MSNFLEYKGYIGSVTYSAEDEIFHGKLIGISDRITYDGDSVKSLKLNFEEAIDDYLEGCDEINKPPHTPDYGHFDVDVSPEIHKKLVAFSFAHNQSLNLVVEEALRRYVV
ncbi:MAG: type II toxin-antitoxin system HicB family antitoxin [Defluviitaleaceae bacterium]|nr:type II toxin-antitoxin system HicB family antitoxin [Defluviitaleaceae bacterium]MCL2263607.1 type II toxin-antitoxin system HicB family antitoxin [Defluviitaleaceae bacterium]